MSNPIDLARLLPQDGFAGTLVGRAWVPGELAGPSVVAVTREGVFDISRAAPTLAHLCNAKTPLDLIGAAPRDRRLGSVEALLENSLADRRDAARPWLLAPCDLQAVKGAGVTFAASLLERVVEEQARGEPGRSAEIRAQLTTTIGREFADIQPGSPEAARLKLELQRQGLWSQYLEVGIGPDVEIFTKCQPMAPIGLGAEIGLHPGSVWNNPEPEIVLAVNARGESVGATLGNDVNLRDYEGRSALLLGLAKDNNASCVLGPFLRLFDDSFTIGDVGVAEVQLTVAGADGFVLEGRSSMSKISRKLPDMVGQVIGGHHQYPDGFFLFLGTMFAPTKDRDQPGAGFTHHMGDLVTIASPKLGALVNRVNRSDRVPPWEFGLIALMQNLSLRGLL